MRTTFKAYERLKREQHIDTLFRTGKAFSVFPLRLLFLKNAKSENEIAPVRVAFSVPKKRFKKAVDRNRTKRLLREAWRLQKADLYDVIPTEIQLHVFFIFTNDKEQDFDTIQLAVSKGIVLIKKQILGNE